MSTFRFFSAVCLIVVAFLLLETDASPKPNIKGKNRPSSSGNAKPNAALTLQNQRDVDARGTGLTRYDTIKQKSDSTKQNDSTRPVRRKPLIVEFIVENDKLTPQNEWDVDARGTGLTLYDKFKDPSDLTPKQLIVKYTGPHDGFYSVLAKQPVPNGNVGTFYFEVKVISKKGFIFIGLGTKSMPLNEWPGHHVGTYAYGNGEIWGHEGSRCSYQPSLKEGSYGPRNRRLYIGGKPGFEEDDVVGCGVNLKTSEIIYTKNGQPLATTDLLVSSTADLFPCVWMHGTGNKIEANFGPTFLYKALEIVEN